MTKKQLIFGAVAAAFVLVGAYLTSPLLAANAFKSAAQAGDADKLQRLVDFPAVRESLKGQLNAMVMQSIQSDPDLKDNPFAGLAAVMAPALVNQAIEGYVTAEGLSAMMSASRPTTAATSPSAPIPASTAKPASASPALEHRYKDLNTFVITSISPENSKARFSFILHRQGLFNWRLTRIELPKDLMARPVAAPAAQLGPVSEATPPEPHALLDRWAQENEACRGGSGDDPVTEQACAAREITDNELQKAGWCYGENAAYGYQSEWRACGSPKFASVADAEAAAQADAQ